MNSSNNTVLHAIYIKVHCLILQMCEQPEKESASAAENGPGGW